MTQTKAELLQTRHQGDIRLGDADSTHYVGFKAPATVSSSLVWTLPAADGTANYLLKTDGSGNLGWTADNTGVSLSGSTDNTLVTVAGANSLQGEGNLTFNGSELKLPTGSGTQGLQFQASSGANANLRGVGTNYGELGFFIGNSEKFRLASSGKVGIGLTAPETQLEVLGSVWTKRVTADQWGEQFRGRKDRAGSIVQDNDDILTILGQGYDGSAYRDAAKIEIEIDGTPGSQDMPGRLVFSTTADGANSSTERMRIDSAGKVGIGTTSQNGFDKFVVNGTGNVIAAEAASGAVGIGLFENGTGRFYLKSLNGSDGIAFVDADNSSERMRIDSAGRVIIGESGAITTSSNRLFQVVGDTNGGGVIVLGRNDTTLTNESLGGIEFYGNDPGSAFTRAASIMCEAAAEWTSSDYPTKLIFKTTPDGSATNTLALTLDSSQNATFASAIYGPVKTVSALELDLSTGNYFIKTISGNSTFTFANPAASGTVTAFTLELTHSSGTVTWPSEVKWNGDTAPTLTAGKTHLFMFVTDDGGSRYRGSALVDYVN